MADELMRSLIDRDSEIDDDEPTYKMK
jgi:hypothetical protein